MNFVGFCEQQPSTPQHSQGLRVHGYRVQCSGSGCKVFWGGVRLQACRPPRSRRFSLPPWSRKNAAEGEGSSRSRNRLKSQFAHPESCARTLNPRSLSLLQSPDSPFLGRAFMTFNHPRSTCCLQILRRWCSDAFLGDDAAGVYGKDLGFGLKSLTLNPFK